MVIRPATKHDTCAIAELAMMSCDGIPSYFWGKSQSAGETIIDAGARQALSEEGNFSYKNALLAILDNHVAGMMLGYRLPPKGVGDRLENYPEFIRPLIELEQCVPDSYYINMLATYPRHRNQGIGRALLERVDNVAHKLGCTLSSVGVFEENCGALRLYQRLGYHTIARRQVPPHRCHQYQGDILLLAREVEVKAVAFGSLRSVRV